MIGNNIQHCPTCGQSVNEREIALFRGMIPALWAVFKWCEEKKTHEFSRKDVKHLLGDESSRAHFGDWILFGGLVYRREHKRGLYGLNKERLIEFFSGKLEVPTKIYKNPLTKELRKEDYRTIKAIPGLTDFLTAEGDYMANYIGQVNLDEVRAEMERENKPKKKTRLKKGQVPCPKCGEVLKSGVETEPGMAQNSLFMKRFRECPNCKFREDLP